MILISLRWKLQKKFSILMRDGDYYLIKFLSRARLMSFQCLMCWNILKMKNKHCRKYKQLDKY